MRLTRKQVIAYRVAAQGLHRDAGSIDELAVLDIGVQQAMGHLAATAFAARLPAPVDLSPTAVPIGPDRPLALAWTLRGAPHVHRRTDLDAVAAALWPLSEADAAGRLNETGPSVARAGIAALDQFQRAVDAMAAVVTAPTAKGAASAAVTRRLPAVMHRDCRPCRASHVSDSAMRSSAPMAGLELDDAEAPPLLVPRRAARRPTGPDPAALRRLIMAYLRLLGPATVADAAGYLGARRADVAQHWPGDALVDVTIDGRPAQLPADRVDAVRAAPPAALVRLLSGFDPWLQARDRDLIVPDRTMHKPLWPALGRPGVLFVDGEVVGVWRTKATPRRLTIAVEAFAPLPPRAWTEIEAEAQRQGEVRGRSDIVVTRT